MSQNKAFSTPFILAVLCIYFSYFLHGISVITLAQNMSSLAEKFSTDNAGIAYLISGIGLGRLISILFFGVISDKFGRRAVILMAVIMYLLFFFGIHPSVLSPITSPISTQFLAENIAAVQAGHVATHFYAPGPESAFGNFTGSGVTIGCVFWCLMSKNKALKQVGRLSFIPALFGINEPILFGAPIVLNPMFFIPFVICGGIIGSLGGWAMYLGIMKCSTFTPPYVGVFLEGFLTNMDPMSIVVNAVQLILSILIWYPFVKSYEKTYGNKEEETNAISAEDAAILDDLDLDF